MIAGVVLAGGQSSRMGCDKSLLELCGISLIEHSKNLLRDAGIDNIYISGHQGIKDQYVKKGPLAGMLASLEYLKDFKYVFFTAVDMPLINKQIFKYLFRNKNSHTVYIEKYFFPLLICNSVTNREKISIQLSNGNLSIKNMLKEVGGLSLKNQFANELFLNANTKEDWRMILKINSLTD